MHGNLQILEIFGLSLLQNRPINLLQGFQHLQGEKKQFLTSKKKVYVISGVCFFSIQNN